MAVIIRPVESADMWIIAETSVRNVAGNRCTAASPQLALGRVGHTNQGSGPIEASVPVGLGRGVTELPDSRDPVSSQQGGGELFEEGLSHASEISSNPF